ncbi:hypothetical protein QE152_g7340 [Popillia japonica]|uniref:Uncharacterized protein n=1 Tax=Popillia japonica TaxID=7064 RepID=A0AAW1MBF1_POPJA
MRSVVDLTLVIFQKLTEIASLKDKPVGETQIAIIGYDRGRRHLGYVYKREPTAEKGTYEGELSRTNHPGELKIGIPIGTLCGTASNVFLPEQDMEPVVLRYRHSECLMACITVVKGDVEIPIAWKTLNQKAEQNLMACITVVKGDVEIPIAWKTLNQKAEQKLIGEI